MTVQIVEIAGQKMAVLPVADYERLIDAAEDRAEDLGDALAAAAAERRRTGGEAYLPADAVDRILNGESALRIWRRYRGLTQAQLGERANCRGSDISRFESGVRGGSTKLWRTLADALGVTTDDIIPVI